MLSVVSQRRWYAPVRRVKDAIEDGRIGAARARVGRSPRLAGSRLLRDGCLARDAGRRGRRRPRQPGSPPARPPPLVPRPRGRGRRLDEQRQPSRDRRRGHGRRDDPVRSAARWPRFVASNSQRPGLHARVHVHGSNGASVGVETDARILVRRGRHACRARRGTISGRSPARRRHSSAGRLRTPLHSPASTRRPTTTSSSCETSLPPSATDAPPAVDGAEGRATVELIEAIYRAAVTGERVRLEAVEG